MIVKTFFLSIFQKNTRVVVCEKTGKAVCIDPGEDSPELVSFVRENGYDLQAITLTHAHLDHIGGVGAFKKAFPDAEIILHADDEVLYQNLPQQPLRMGLPPEQLKALGLDYDVPPPITRYWKDGEEYSVGELVFKVLHCPGHTQGHVVFAEMKEQAVFAGDSLFAGSIGRTDLPGGNHQQLIDSINNKILPLGDGLTVYSGHGPDTTIGRERQTNPFLTGMYEPG